MNKFFEYLGYITIFLVFIFLILIGIWNVFPYKPFSINEPITTDKEIYHANDILLYNLNYCKNSDVIVTVSRGFVDGVIYSMPDVSASNPEGCRTTEIQVQVPNLPTGKYKLRVTYTYQVNPIRRFSLTYFTNEFSIVETNEL
jgi:hypothetical protein